MFNNPFKKAEKKSHSSVQVANFFSKVFNFRDDSSDFIEYYIKSAPVFIATKYIVDAASAIPIIIKDTKKDEFIYDHPALKLLNNPNPFKDGTLFKKEVIGSYVLTGNCYLNIVGKFDPVELDTISPKCINIEANSKDGYAQTYTVTSDGYQYIYNRNDKKKFTDKQDNQLSHLRDYNPNDKLVGASTFAGCELEISQYILASIHNNALLENGARPDALITYKGNEPLADNQVQDVRKILKGELSGASNAGKTTFLNGEFDFIQLSQSIKDMDFPTLKKSTEEKVYKAAKIPLAMVSSDNMSFNNMGASKYDFYDNSVLPTVKQILDFLTDNVLKRYKGSENLEFTYDDSAIEAIADRKIDNALKIGQTGSVSLNEIRTIMGYESLKTGGDVIYQPMNLVPVGEDNYISDNRAKLKEKAIFIKTMQEGGYSKDQINKAVIDYYDNPKSK